MVKKIDRIQVSEETRKAMIEEVKDYFLNERDEEIGDLAAGLLLDFITEKLAPEYYNQGVYDSCNYMKDRVEDLLTIQL